MPKRQSHSATFAVKTPVDTCMPERTSMPADSMRVEMVQGGREVSMISWKGALSDTDLRGSEDCHSIVPTDRRSSRVQCTMLWKCT